MEQLLQRLETQEAISAIIRLKAWYAECADAKYTDDHHKKPAAELDAIAWKQALCFTEDAVWNAGPFGSLAGRAAVYEYFRTRAWAFTMHMYVNPQIDVRGNVATGKWVQWLLGTEEQSRKPVHMCGYTRDEYRKVDGSWLFSRVDLHLKFNVPFGQPWTAAPQG
jgi:hypothetical protein